MSLPALREKYERELDAIREEKARLADRAAFLERAIAEVGGAAAKAPARKSPKRPARKRRSGMTAAEAILKSVAGAPAPIPPKDIIARAGELSGGAAASIRTQINALAKAGRIEQVPHEGRGYLYRVPGSGAKAPAKKAKAPAKKAKAPAKKAKAPAKRKKPPARMKKSPAKKRKSRAKKKAPAKKPAAPAKKQAPAKPAPSGDTPAT